MILTERKRLILERHKDLVNMVVRSRIMIEKQ